MKHTRTPEDDFLRAEVCRTILIGLCEDADFGNQKTFAAWQRTHKLLLVELFGGQGIVNLGRVVAWLRREALGLRREPVELLCRIADALDAGSLPEETKNKFIALGVTSRAELIQRVMIDSALARSLLRPGAL